MIYVGCAARDGQAHLADTDELDQLAWCPLSQLSDYIPHGIFQPVRDHLRVADRQ